MKSLQPNHSWRSDIEGLRGLSILLVVLYHISAPLFTGGFIGVDVFFVLSGYLITGMLFREVEQTGTIQIANFFARRARRLLPAAAVLLVCVLGFSFLFYSPLAQIQIAMTSLATSLYASNLFFGLKATDYLAAEAETNPLLHTWSLAVEEQFYAVWPFLLILFLFAYRNRASTRKSFLIFSAVFAGTSFALMIFLMQSGWNHWAFFLSPARAWEFSLGGIAALLPLKSKSSVKPVGLQIMGWAGVIGLVAGGVLYTRETPFPGWAALLPVVGTLLVLRAGAHNPSTVRLLSWKPLLILGRLSYSWYLWHWPVLVFAHGLFGELELGIRLALAALSLGMAALSYYWVEEPVRRHPVLARRAAYGISMLLVTTILLASSSGLLWKTARQAAVSPGQEQFFTVRDDIPDLYARECHVDQLETKPADCSDGPEDAQVQVALFGDSHAAQWAPALKIVAEELGWKVNYYTKSACPAIAMAPFNPKLKRPYVECDLWRNAVIDSLRKRRPDIVILSSYEGYALSQQEWDSAAAEIIDTLSRSVASVVVLHDSPRAWTDMPDCLSRVEWQTRMLGRSWGRSCDFPLDTLRAASQSFVSATKNHSNVVLMDFRSEICPDGTCKAIGETGVRYRDNHHLAASYVASLADSLKHKLTRVLSENQHARSLP